MKQVKVAVLCARHDPTKDVIPARACIEMMLTNSHHTSVLNYWANVTDGYLNFVGSTVFPWVDITITADDVSRETQCARAYEATKALNGGDLEGFDVFVVLTVPGQLLLPGPPDPKTGKPTEIVKAFDGGAGAVVQGKPACALPVVGATHTFMCHEVGHVLGWSHSYGVLNNGIEWDGEAPFDQAEVYGDPYDIMSSASFGSRRLDPKVTHYSGNPEFKGPAVVGWPDAAAVVMGPAPARAHLHLFAPEALAPARVRHFPSPQVGQRLLFTLTAAGHPGGTQLVVLHPIGEDASGRGRCYVEYRQKGGWDAGLEEFGNDLSRQGVVVHALASTLEGVRCWYRGRVLVPLELDSDVSVANTPMHVRVLSADVGQGTVDIEVTSRLARGVEIHARGSDEIITVINPQTMTTPCGDVITYGTWITQTQYFYTPVSYGFGGAGAPDAAQLLAKWSVGGIELEGLDGSVDVPTTEGEFTIQYNIDPITAELHLASGGGLQYRVDVTAAMSEPDGSGTTRATVVFRAKGFFDGYGPGDQGKLDRCMFKYAKSARRRLRDHLIPPGPDPYYQELVDQINQVRLRQLIGQIATAHPGPASALTALSAMRFGVKGLSQALPPSSLLGRRAPQMSTRGSTKPPDDYA